MTHPTDEGCGFYTDLPDHSRNVDSAGRGFSSSTPRPGSRARMAFPTLPDGAPMKPDAPDYPDGEVFYEVDDGSIGGFSGNLSEIVRAVTLVVVFLVTAGMLHTGLNAYRALTTHPDPVTQDR